MRSIKILQTATVGTFILFVVIGLVILFFDYQRLDAYGRFINIIYPIFIAEVIPAFLGTPLKEAVKKIGAKTNEVT